VTGVDIDAELVLQAGKLWRLRSSRVHPATEDPRHAIDYFPISAALKHGFRPLPDPTLPTPPPASFAPAAVEFASADWVVSAKSETPGPFDVILLLSVVKWIHLEHGDDGLGRLFAKCAALLVPGGHLVLEVHPWKSYQKSVTRRKAPHFQERLKTLKLRPETSFPEILKAQGFSLCASSLALPRQLDVYRKE
jgi:7SK snRNA methylphosphate capping enzyme